MVKLNASGRLKLHQQGLKALRSGLYSKAVLQFTQCLELHGPHVGLLSDLALTAYLAEDIALFRLTTERLEAEFLKSKNSLSLPSIIKTRMALSKCYELLGRVAEAFHEIQLALSLAPAGDPQSYILRGQKLRLLATFGRESDVAAVYQECLSVSEKEPETMIECYHALLVAEARLFGIEAAWPRFLSLERNRNLHAADRQLCLIDILEVAIEKNDDSGQKKILDFIDSKKVGPFDTYESTVIRMAQDSRWEMSVDDVISWTPKIAPMGLIRLLALELHHRPHSNLFRRFTFFLQAVDHRSRKILYKKWQFLLQDEAGVEIALDLKRKTLRSGEKELSFAKSPQSWALLAILVHQKEVGIDDLLNALRKSAQGQNLEALRINVLRLNKKLTNTFHSPWFFKFGKEGVISNPKVRFVSEK